MIKNPLISIITVTYNAAGTLEETIKSVISQDYDNFEYIVIDGGSADGTADIIKKYAGHITYWVSEPDGGIYDAMNKGIRAAKGEIVNLLNAGDRYASCDVVSSFAGHFISDPKSRWAYGLVGLYNGKDPEPVVIGRKKLDRYVEHCHQGFFYRKDLHEDYGYYDVTYKIAADHYFMLKVYKGGDKPFFLDKLAVYYLLGGESDRRLEALAEEKRAQEEVFGRSAANSIRYIIKLGSYGIRKIFENINILRPVLFFIRKIKHRSKNHGRGTDD
jgi:glycosyltransferase involved in cell wall biosynthesis